MSHGYPWNRGGLSKLAAGAIALAVIAIVAWLAFAGVPFRGGHELRLIEA